MCPIEKTIVFNEQIRRIQSVTGVRTQAELAQVLGVKQSSISDAKRRGKIPPGWLLVLLRTHKIYPEWILDGKGPCFADQPHDCASNDAEESNNTNVQVLRSVPAKALADELLRRIEAHQGAV